MSDLKLFGIPVFITEHALPGAMLIVKDRATVDALLAAEKRADQATARLARVRESRPRHRHR